LEVMLINFFCRMNFKTRTVIRFVSISVKFGICNVVGLNGTLVEAKIQAQSSVPSAYFSTKMCPMRMQMLNFAIH
jgi:hypothetical protein